MERPTMGVDAARREYRSRQQHVSLHVKMVLPQYLDDASELATKVFQWQALIGQQTSAMLTSARVSQRRALPLVHTKTHVGLPKKRCPLLLFLRQGTTLSASGGIIIPAALNQPIEANDTSEASL